MEPAAKGVKLCGVPVKVQTRLWFGLDEVNDDGTIQNENEYDMSADYSTYPTLVPATWAVSTVTNGTEYFVRMTKPPQNTPVSHRREVGLRLDVASLIGLEGADASQLVPAAADSHPARGRGIELVLWKVAVLSFLHCHHILVPHGRHRGIKIVTSPYWCTQAILGAPSRGAFGVKISEGSWVERKGSSASSRHQYGKVVAVVQQSDTTTAYASWLKGIWLLTAFPVLPSTDGATASAARHETEIAMISRQSVSVRDPNEKHIIDSFETSHRHHDGAMNMLA